MENDGPKENMDSVRPKDPSRKKKSLHKKQKGLDKDDVSAEFANLNKSLSLKIPPGFREYPTPAFDVLPPPADQLPLPTFKELPPPAFDEIPPYRDPPSYEELHFKKKIKLNYLNEFNAEGAVKGAATPRSAQNGAATPKRGPDFVTPQVKYWRQNLLPLLTCARCMRLFDNVRRPLMITAGTSACAECASHLYGISLLKARQSLPLNSEFVSVVQNLLYSLKLFHEDIPFCSELDRGINKCNFSKKINTLFWDLRQKLLHHDQCVKHLNHLMFCNEINWSSLITALNGTEECKLTILNTAPLNVKANSLIDTFAGIEEFKYVFDVSFDEYGDETEWLMWNKIIDTPVSLYLDKKLLQSVYALGLDLTLFQDVGYKRYYSKVTGINNTVYLHAFTPSVPNVSLRGLGKFARFDPLKLNCFTEFFFEIKICGVISPDYCPLPCRYLVTLEDMEISRQAAYLFLGYKSSGFLGAEVEVTKEKVIFNQYLRNGLPQTANIESPELWRQVHFLKPIRQGMVVSESTHAVNKISIFKHDDPSQKVRYQLGLLNAANLGTLRLIPLGKHLISACGIGIFIDDGEC